MSRARIRRRFSINSSLISGRRRLRGVPQAQACRRSRNFWDSQFFPWYQFTDFVPRAESGIQQCSLRKLICRRCLAAIWRNRYRDRRKRQLGT
jgi:hypothetical protein